MNNQPIFIIGMPRSGTTLLSSIINASQQIYIPEETHVFHVYDIYRNIKSKKSFIDYYFSSENKYIYYLNISGHDIDDIRNRYNRNDINQIEYIIENIVSIKNVFKYDRWGEKTPIHFKYVEQIKEIYPNSKFLCIIRDPRDIMISLKKVQWTKLFNLKRNINDYKKLYKLYNKELSNPDYVFLKYEELLDSPSKIIQLIYDKLNLTYKHEILSSLNNSEFQNFDVNKEPWKATKFESVNDTNKYKWLKNENDIDLIAYTSHELRKEIALLEYPIYKGKPSIIYRLKMQIIYYLYFVKRQINKIRI